MKFSATGFFPEGISIEKFCTKWFVYGTTLSFWKTRKNPTITYEILPSSKPPSEFKIRDTVEYTTGSSTKKNQVIGTDTWISAQPLDFVWRGNGVLFLLSSKCKIVYFDDKEGIAITFFEKTLFTDEGMDILTRAPITQARKDELAKQLPSQFEKYSKQFFIPDHTLIEK